ncbi:hypothetical protein [uncultured Prevotella sp.]|mgnify:FL=1|uniref:hypothetical protein n=1 Tax=uncultured Prevotella sp. TaxID=159272 RepID=UPI002601F953|nr:hypothetical protein [uncultured Prevotella sp.]
MKKKKYFAPEINVIEMESSNIMAGSGNPGSPSGPSSPGLPDTSTSGWTPDGNTNHGFGIVEEKDGDYSDEDF